MITIEDQPYTLTAVGQPLIIVASSDNVGNTGFRYKVVVTNSSSGDVITLYLPPNPNDKLVFDLNPILSKWCVNQNTYDGVLVHFADMLQKEQQGNGVIPYAVNILEAWQILGVLTDDDASTETFNQYVWNARYQVSDSYRPNPATRYGLTTTSKYVLSSRYANTHTPDIFPQISGVGNIVYVPVRENDYGVISMYNDFNNEFGLGDARKVRVTLAPSSGSPVVWTETQSGANLLHWAVFPANLNANTVGMPKPSDYPNWKYIAVQALDNSNNIVSASYVLYNAALYGGTNCKYDNVRLGWVNEHGGWDYFNFSMKNEESIEVERRRYRKVVGTYASPEFGFNSFDRGLTERTPIVSRFLNIDSGWLQEGEYVFLKSLLQSSSVYIINDDATVTPVVVEDTSYLVRRARDKKQYNQSLKLRYSHNVNV